MKCHYDVLGVGRDASDDEIKRSYRKLALKWHPDKNLDRNDEATRLFTEIQQAYDVLSDPQERAWYDRHREAILRGGVDDYVDDSLNLMQFFSSSAYSGFGDDEKGFFAVFRRVFSTIVEEDSPFDGPVHSEGEEKIPLFGDSTSSYEETVHAFYAYWQSYFTKKSFVWLEKYDVRQAPSRWAARQMEKENKKVRDAAKKERNEVIRKLVSYVRKRDPRVKERQQVLKARQEEIAKRFEEERLRQKRERRKELEGYKEQDWVAASASRLDTEMEAMERWLDEEFDEGDEEGEEESPGDEDLTDDGDGAVDDLYCVACDKLFRSENALVNHAQSRKHKDRVALLKAELVAEDEEFGFVDVGERGAVGGEGAEKLSKKQRRKARKEKQQKEEQEQEQEQDEIDHSVEQQEAEEEMAVKKEKKKKTGKETTKRSVDSKEDSELECQICRETFPSRNKLFQHIKATNHAVLVEKSSSKKTKGKGKKNKK